MSNLEVDWISLLDEEFLVSILIQPNQKDGNMAYDDFFKYIKPIYIQVDPESTIDEIGNSQLPVAIDGQCDYFSWPEYWNELKREMVIILCTEDRKYINLRRKLKDSANKFQTTIVSTISAAMASQFGVVAGVIVPFISLCLIVLARAGKEAFCNSTEWNMPLKRKDVHIKK